MAKSSKREWVYTSVSKVDFARLEKIVKAYKFKSIYDLTQHLVYCFLRVADKEHDTVDAPLPSEIEDMFDGYAECERRAMIKPQRRVKRTVNEQR